MTLVLIAVVIANAITESECCAWATPITLLPANLVQGVNAGLDHTGTWSISAIFQPQFAKKGFQYEVISVAPSDVEIEHKFIDSNSNSTILAHKRYTPNENSDEHLQHENIFTIDIGCKCNNKKIASAVYTIKLTGNYDFSHHYDQHATETENGWQSNATLVFMPDVNHYSQINLTKQLGCQYIYVNSSLKLLTSKNNTCGTSGGCLAISEIELVRKMNCTHNDHISHSRVLAGISVSYAVSMVIQLSINQTSSPYPLDFDTQRRRPVMFGTNVRYDICQANKCNRQTANCTDDQQKNQLLIDDTGIHVQQNQTSSIDYIHASCAFEPFSFIDGYGSPFIYVQTWFKYDSGEPAPNSTWRANAHDGWWCPPHLKKHLQKAPTITQVRRKLYLTQV